MKKASEHLGVDLESLHKALGLEKSVPSGSFLGESGQKQEHDLDKMPKEEEVESLENTIVLKGYKEEMKAMCDKGMSKNDIFKMLREKHKKATDEGLEMAYNMMKGETHMSDEEKEEMKKSSVDMLNKLVTSYNERFGSDLLKDSDLYKGQVNELEKAVKSHVEAPISQMKAEMQELVKGLTDTILEMQSQKGIRQSKAGVIEDRKFEKGLDLTGTEEKETKIVSYSDPEDRKFIASELRKAIGEANAIKDHDLENRFSSVLADFNKGSELPMQIVKSFENNLNVKITK